MPDSRAARLADGSRQWARIGLALLVIGPSTLLVGAWVEVLNHPGLSLLDGYRFGREPWTSVGIGGALAGGIIGLVAGDLAIVIEGSWTRRLIALGAALAAGAWWATALGVLPYDTSRAIDPIGFAFRLPVASVLLALAPAALVASLCLSPLMQTVERPRMRRLPSAGRQPRTPFEAGEDQESGGGGKP